MLINIFLIFVCFTINKIYFPKPTMTRPVLKLILTQKHLLQLKVLFLINLAILEDVILVRVERPSCKFVPVINISGKDTI